ncbi:hypothetical protein [Dyadobacter flavalbus]|uniref:hypothetical protein n=1 Tax=Dyadobacter flavalbus TaxID=2579942 RepID=UPI00191C00AE|nr:hypothetical protein [Dyadobacter flavalbus]
MNDTSILHIKEQKTGLNKRQKEFNLLSQNIEELSRLIPELESAYEEMLRRIPTDLGSSPLLVVKQEQVPIFF